MTIRLLIDLKGILNSKGKLSEWEEELVLRPIGKSGVDFIKAALVSSCVSWRVFRGTSVVSRMSLSTFAAVAAGRWYGGRSMDAGIDMLLGLDGTRIQTELASLILREYQHDRSLLMLVRKHFYSEQVYGDVNPDVPRFRWRPRNSYVDSASSQNHTQGDRAELHRSSHKYRPTTKNNDATKSDSSESNELPEKQTTAENRDWNLFVDPLESIFGYSEDSKDTKPIGQSEEPEVLSRRHARARKRAHKSQRSNAARHS